MSLTLFISPDCATQNVIVCAEHCFFAEQQYAYIKSNQSYCQEAPEGSVCVYCEGGARNDEFERYVYDSERDYGEEEREAYEYATVTTWEVLPDFDRLLHGWLLVEEDTRLSSEAKNYMLSLWMETLQRLGFDPHALLASSKAPAPEVA